MSDCCKCSGTMEWHPVSFALPAYIEPKSKSAPTASSISTTQVLPMRIHACKECHFSELFVDMEGNIPRCFVVSSRASPSFQARVFLAAAIRPLLQLAGSSLQIIFFSFWLRLSFP